MDLDLWRRFCNSSHRSKLTARSDGERLRSLGGRALPPRLGVLDTCISPLAMGSPSEPRLSPTELMSPEPTFVMHHSMARGDDESSLGSRDASERSSEMVSSHGSDQLSMSIGGDDSSASNGGAVELGEKISPLARVTSRADLDSLASSGSSVRAEMAQTAGAARLRRRSHNLHARARSMPARAPVPTGDANTRESRAHVPADWHKADCGCAIHPEGCFSKIEQTLPGANRLVESTRFAELWWTKLEPTPTVSFREHRVREVRARALVLGSRTLASLSALSRARA